MLDIQKLVLGERFFKKLKPSSTIFKTPRSTRKGLIQAGSSGAVLVVREGILVSTKIILFGNNSVSPPERVIHWPGVTSSNGSSRENVIG